MEVAQLEQESGQTDFWDDNRAAQAAMARIAALHDQTDHWRELARQIEDLQTLFELAEADGDEALAEDIDTQAADLNRCIDDREFELLLGGTYDHHNAILAVHAGTGGVDSQDWTQMLLRMYLRWA
ncbi:MAG TPA: PCRF domain-containing protein, partial [Chloroflexota bacterium]|nr:PCRF domain-containing protein [Chloroflexota bacterium]